MAIIRQIQTGELIQVAENPAWVNGTWECGDRRYLDEHGDQYEVVSLNLPPVPEAIEPLQGLLVLDSVGLATAYEAWAKSPERTFAERAFIERAPLWRRADPVLQSAATALGLTPDQLDAMFRMAPATTAGESL